MAQIISLPSPEKPRPESITVDTERLVQLARTAFHIEFYLDKLVQQIVAISENCPGNYLAR